MSFEADFLNMMTPGVKHRALASRDTYGSAVAGPITEVLGHITYKKKVVRTDTQADVMSAATVIIPPPGFLVNGIPTPNVSDGDEIALEGDENYRHVISAVIYNDETGHHHQTLMLT